MEFATAVLRSHSIETDPFMACDGNDNDNLHS